MRCTSLNLRIGIVVGCLLAVGYSRADVEYNAERYKVILEREPFGSDPEVLNEAEKLAAETAQKQDKATADAIKKLEKDFRLCFLQESNSGEALAGFQNKRPQQGDPKSVMLREGETYRKVKLVKVDLARSIATLMFEGKELEFALAKDPNAVRGGSSSPPPPRRSSRRFNSGFRSKKPDEAPRQAPERPQLSPEEQARVREETRERLRDYQMEVLREGMPPLPIPLTQEMDDQLVAEGVLPPAEDDDD